MPEFRLTQAAEEDLIGIALYGDEQFGEEQSNRYRDQLKRHFALLAMDEAWRWTCTHICVVVVIQVPEPHP